MSAAYVGLLRIAPGSKSVCDHIPPGEHSRGASYPCLPLCAALRVARRFFVRARGDRTSLVVLWVYGHAPPELSAIPIPTTSDEPSNDGKIDVALQCKDGCWYENVSWCTVIVAKLMLAGNPPPGISLPPSRYCRGATPMVVDAGIRYHE